MMKTIIIHDPTLRDGNHAMSHQISVEQIKEYTAAANRSGIPIVEVGHGNGIGASSLQIGESRVSDIAMLTTARKELVTSKLGIHCMPGIATIKRDLKPALDIGVDVVRVASHCTEADITQRHIEFIREYGREAHGTLMMTHMASKERLLEEARKMESYGAQAVVLMDSAGAYLAEDVTERIGLLASSLSIPVGFHAHNNLGMSIANSIAAAEAGAKILDGTARGFGAGAGNTPIELLVPVLEKKGFATKIDFYKILDMAEIAEDKLINVLPSIKTISIVSGIAGVFSGFAKHVERVSIQYGVDPRDVFFELGKRKVVGGQEDLIIEVAMDILEEQRKDKGL